MTSTYEMRPAEAAAFASGPAEDPGGRSEVEAYWNARAASFDATDPSAISRTEKVRREWKAILRDVVGEAPLFALDAGCGTGDLALLLHELGHVVAAADVSIRMVERTRDKAWGRGARVDVRRGFAEALPFADESFDVVLARNVLWDLAAPELALRDWMRVLRPGGRVVVIESRWIESAAGPLRRILRALGLPGRPRGAPVPPASRPFPRPAPAEDAVEFLRAMGLERAMFLDLEWLRGRDCATLSRARRAFAHPEGRHYAVWASRI
jgi:SAM-dependent methyltransferase